ncbi:peptidase [Streptomyces sp. NPDC003027]
MATAVTTPVLLLSAAPAFADTKPAPAAGTQKTPTHDELKAAVAAAQKTYDEAAAKVDAAVQAFRDMDKTSPLKAAADAAEKAADEAAAAKTAADAAVVEAQAKLDAAATDEEKTAARTALDEARKTAEEAAAAKTAADTKASEASGKYQDARVAASQEIHRLQAAEDAALKALDKAEKALEEYDELPPTDPCVVDEKFTTVVRGLPGKLVAGTTVPFTLRVTNGGDETLDNVFPEVDIWANHSKGTLDTYLDLEWSTDASPKWQDVDRYRSLALGSMKAKTSVDVRLRLKIDAKSPAGQGTVQASGHHVENNDGGCGTTTGMNVYAFSLAKAPKGSTGGSGSGNGNGTGGNTGTTQQGGTSTTPVTGNRTTTGGTLAKTGSSDAVPRIALAGAAAVALGAGAMVVARRRRTGADA